MNICDYYEQEERTQALDIVKEELKPWWLNPSRWPWESLRLGVMLCHRDARIDRMFAAQLVHREIDKVEFLSWDQLLAIVEEPMVPGRPRLEADLDESASIYIFVSLRDGLILKVGSTKDSRDRIARKHLRHGEDMNTLRGYLRYRGWPRVIEDEEIVLLVLPMDRYTKEERLAGESGLEKLLDPEIRRARK